MLYLEEGEQLRLFTPVPRNWLEDGKKIELENVQSYFGPITAKLNSCLDKGFTQVSINCLDSRKPTEVLIRIRPIENQKAVRVLQRSHRNGADMILFKSGKWTASILLPNRSRSIKNNRCI